MDHLGESAVAERQCPHVGDHERTERVRRDLGGRGIDTDPGDARPEQGGETALATTDVEHRAAQLGGDVVVDVLRHHVGPPAIGVRVVVGRERRHRTPYPRAAAQRTSSKGSQRSNDAPAWWAQ